MKKLPQSPLQEMVVRLLSLEDIKTKKVTQQLLLKVQDMAKSHRQEISHGIEAGQEELAQIADSLYHKNSSPHMLMEKLHVCSFLEFLECSLFMIF